MFPSFFFWMFFSAEETFFPKINFYFLEENKRKSLVFETWQNFFHVWKEILCRYFSPCLMQSYKKKFFFSLCVKKFCFVLFCFFRKRLGKDKNNIFFQENYFCVKYIFQGKKNGKNFLHEWNKVGEKVLSFCKNFFQAVPLNTELK